MNGVAETVPETINTVVELVEAIMSLMQRRFDLREKGDVKSF